jgi:hypothetical protein
MEPSAPKEAARLLSPEDPGVIVGLRRGLAIRSPLPSGSRTEESDGVSVQAETAEGVPAEPPTLTTVVPNWRAGDSIPLGGRTLRVVGIRDNDADEPPVLVVDDLAG